MQYQAKSIRPFIGAKDFKTSCRFYRALGFEEKQLGGGMAVFTMQGMSFYLQDAYVKDWVDNTMVFLEVQDLTGFWENLLSLDLPSKFPGVRIHPVVYKDWGAECFIHDPSGILWHVGSFT